MTKKRKIVARRMEEGIEVVQYQGDPPHRWYRLTPLSAAET